MTLTELFNKRKQLKEQRSAILDSALSESRALSADEDANISSLDGQLTGIEVEIGNKERDLRNVTPTSVESRRRFSLMSAIRNVANGRALDDVEAEIVEMGRQEMRRGGLSHSGQIVMPMEYRNTIQATIAGYGIENVPEDKLGILEPLRNALIMVQAGATYMTGLVGDISIPVYSGSNVNWAGEVAAAADGAGGFTEVTLKPNRLAAYLDISKQFLLQDSNSAEALLTADLIRALSEKLETTLLGSAAASATSPGGIFNIILSSGVINTWEDIVGLETAMEINNVFGPLKYLLSPAAKGLFRTTPKDAGTGLFVLQNGEIDGIPVLSSNSVTAGKFVLGNWSDYVVAQWGGIDLTVDPYTQAGSGKIRLIINAYFDGKPRRVESFKTASIA